MEILPLLFFLYIGYAIISRLTKAAKTPKNAELLRQLQETRQHIHQNQQVKQTQSPDIRSRGQFAKRNAADAARMAARLNRLKKQQRRLSHKKRPGGHDPRRMANLDTNRSRRRDWGARESKTLALGNLLGMVIAVAVIWMIIARLAQG